MERQPTPPNPAYAQDLRARFDAMPVVRALGFEIMDVQPGMLELRLPYRDELSHRPGFFQGGVIGTMCDFAGGGASGTLLPKGWLSMTVDYTVKLIAPARGDALLVLGRVLQQGKSMSVDAADVYVLHQGRQTHCATALVTMRHFDGGQA